jgi:hypothetical protein
MVKMSSVVFIPTSHSPPPWSPVTNDKKVFPRCANQIRLHFGHFDLLGRHKRPRESASSSRELKLKAVNDYRASHQNDKTTGEMTHV